MATTRRNARHRHTTIVRHELKQRAGVPYEVERRVCTSCRRVVEERPVRRASA